ncbi:ogr/Delta-like zinc finger family protein [Yersinia nurmii]|uniref:Ogr/Delta-like zinc finger family protein n=1 Tax=Yersinia nurmii TaxID=685706 RepID=A0AAW7JZW8_9GAMM|nr:ogr/Delta-like zinc finger family protein [Yersinia nurmii]MDN0088318.1 ogr/Delta-like zinc finger family protein [Yersinia nurmii]
MHCPIFGCSAHSRSSREISTETKVRYNQCANINCGHTFITMEAFIRSIMTLGKMKKAPLNFPIQGQSTLNF